MKTLSTFLLAISCMMGFHPNASADEPKQLHPRTTQEVALDVSQFGKYLHDGNPDLLEGLYRSPDGRYLIALIKNHEKGHDFIGVVVSADNSYWKEGEIKFNFVRNDSGRLKGYYYDSQGVAYPVTFRIGANSIKSRLLKKVKLKEIPYGVFASK